MNKVDDYKKAYERQKLAREKAEHLLEVRSRELYESHVTLKRTYEKMRDQQAQLVQQEKLASIGLLAAGVAHEINNPIGFVKSNLQVLDDYLMLINKLLATFQSVAERMHAEPEALDYRKELTALVKLAQENDLAFVIKDSLDSIKESLEGTERVQDITLSLRDFSREDPHVRSQCSINEVIDNALRVLSKELKDKVNIERDYSELPRTYASIGQLTQVFINIIMNAVHAVSAVQTLKIITRKEEENIRIDFIDDGPGIDEGNISKLFDPFFTTKDVGEGTGLGLYITHGLIQRHRGAIEAHNNAGGGACFSITLPIDIRTEPRS
jgi:two-component system NtrC family sensor kinase